MKITQLARFFAGSVMILLVLGWIAAIAYYIAGVFGLRIVNTAIIVSMFLAAVSPIFAGYTYGRLMKYGRIFFMVPKPGDRS